MCPNFETVFERVRPSHISLDGLNLLVSRGGKWSMPSNHASNVFTLTVVLSYFYGKTKLPLYLLATFISFFQGLCWSALPWRRNCRWFIWLLYRLAYINSMGDTKNERIKKKKNMGLVRN